MIMAEIEEILTLIQFLVFLSLSIGLFILLIILYGRTKHNGFLVIGLGFLTNMITSVINLVFFPLVFSNLGSMSERISFIESMNFLGWIVYSFWLICLGIGLSLLSKDLRYKRILYSSNQ